MIVRTIDEARDVPVFVDAVREDREHPERPLARCNFFTLTAAEIDRSAHLGMDWWDVPFQLMGLVGVITQPVGAERFTAAEQIEDLYIRIEKEGRFEIELAELWLPAAPLARGEPIRPGDVYRLEQSLFYRALAFRSGRLGWDRFAELEADIRRGISFSPEETHAFAAWRELQERG